MMGRICSVCGAPVGEDAEILTIAGFGNPRYLCEKCSGLIDTGLHSRDYEEIAEACDALAMRLEARGCEDETVLAELDGIYSEAKERAEKIKLGEYDFSAEEEESEDTETLEIPEELAETEEDRLLDEKEMEESQKFDRMTTWVSAAVFAAAIIFMLLRFVFKVF